MNSWLKYYTIISFYLACCSAHAQQGICLSGNCQEGYGHFQWQSGEEYFGNFEAGKMSGYGIFYWQNKRKFVGNWQQGQMHGEGILFYENGIMKKGLWKRNKFVRLIRKHFVMSYENILHGETQLQAILVDRPNMTSIVRKDDILWQWVVHKLAGEDIESPIFWQANASPMFPIPTGVNAVHAYPTSKTEGRVWVKNNSDSEAMWAGLVFELHNIKNGKAFQKIEEDAKHWRCTKEEYIRRYAELEYKAAKETVVFYNDIWVPYCESKGIKPNPQLWFYYLPDTFEQWMDSFTNPNGYPWHPYSAYYDRLIKTIVKNY